MHLNHVHLHMFICQIVYMPTFVSFNIIYICEDVSILKQFTYVFQVKIKVFLWRGKIRTPSFLLSLPVRVLLTVALINHGTNTFPFSFQSSRRLPVPSLLPSCTSSSWQLSPGCSWKGCSSTSCWWRFLRASTLGGSTSIWSGTACLRWLWPCRQRWTTGATARTKCEWPRHCLDWRCPGEVGVRTTKGHEEPRGFVQAELSQEACLALSLCLQCRTSSPLGNDLQRYFLGKSVEENFVTSLHNISRGDCPKSQFGTISARSSFSNQGVLLIWMKILLSSCGF